jgi:hypothetical protein
VEKQVEYVSATELRIEVSEAEVAAGGVLPVVVRNPPPGVARRTP